jgi:hypothetical protein
VTDGGTTERLSGVPVAQNFFTVLGVEPVVGRHFTPEEAAGNVPREVMISHRLWQQRYGLDPAVVGRTMTLNGAPSPIVGVLPASFDFGAIFAPGRQVDVFGLFPLNDGTNRFGNTLGVVGRLKPGVTI